MDQITNCPVCGSILVDSRHSGDQHRFDCPNCGQYILTGTGKVEAEARVEKSRMFAAILSHTIRRMQRNNSWPMLSSYDVERIQQDGRFPDPAEQAENFLVWLGNEQEHPGSSISYDDWNVRAIVGAVDEHGVAFIVQALLNSGLLEGELTQQGARVSLSFAGWQEFHKLTRGSSAGARAFMAMKFGNDILTGLFQNHFKPAVRQAGFDLFRLDEEPRAGLIDERLRVDIRRARFVVADLTDGNHGAYWEAGFAEGLGKPVIYTCEESIFKGEKTHFDTNHLHTVVWTADEPKKAADDLKATIRATLPDEARMNDPEEQ